MFYRENAKITMSHYSRVRLRGQTLRGQIPEKSFKVFGKQLWPCDNLYIFELKFKISTFKFSSFKLKMSIFKFSNLNLKFCDLHLRAEIFELHIIRSRSTLTDPTVILSHNFLPDS